MHRGAGFALLLLMTVASMGQAATLTATTADVLGPQTDGSATLAAEPASTGATTETAAPSPVFTYAPTASPDEAPLASGQPYVTVPHVHADGVHDHILNTAPRWKTVYAPPGSQGIEFRCPDGPAGDAPVPTGPPGTVGGVVSVSGDDPVVYGCPLRVYDTGYAFGNPQIVVNPEDHREIAFASLHGGATNDGPSDRSRGGQSHTTFTTFEQGTAWADQPPSQQQKPQASGLGEYGSVAMDRDGNLYIGYLWNVPSGADTYQPIIGLYKGPTVHDRTGLTNGAYEHPYRMGTRDDDNTIEEVHLIQLPSYAPPKNFTGNETAAPTTEADNGNATLDLENATEERIVAVWHEAAYDWTNTTTGLSAWIDAAWTDTGAVNKWTRLGKDQLIGPCRQSSNPAFFRDKVYVACVVDRGYADRPRAYVGDIDLWSIDVYTGNTTLEGQVKSGAGAMVGGKPLLAITEDGYMGILSYSKEYRPDGTLERISATAAYKWYNAIDWGRTNDMGYDLRRMGGGSNVPILDADITAFEITNDEKTSVMVYKEWHDDPQEVDMTDYDPVNDPGQFIDQRLNDYNKYFVAFNQCNFPIAAFRMELGQGVDAYNAEQYSVNPAVFNDVADGLTVVREPNGEEVLYFAINDYGAVQYGGIVPSSVAEFCSVGFPVQAVPPQAVPQALTISNPFTTAIGAAMAIPAMAMVGYLLAAKRKAPSYVTAEDE